MFFNIWLCLFVSIQLKTLSCRPSSTTPTAPLFTSNSPPRTSCTWPAASCCRPPTGPTRLRQRGRTRSSPSSTRWWAWWRESSRSVPKTFSACIYYLFVSFFVAVLSLFNIISWFHLDIISAPHFFLIM